MCGQKEDLCSSLCSRPSPPPTTLYPWHSANCREHHPLSGASKREVNTFALEIHHCLETPVRQKGKINGGGVVGGTPPTKQNKTRKGATKKHQTPWRSGKSNPGFLLHLAGDASGASAFPPHLERHPGRGRGSGTCFLLPWILGIFILRDPREAARGVMWGGGEWVSAHARVSFSGWGSFFGDAKSERCLFCSSLALSWEFDSPEDAGTLWESQ